MKTLLAVLLCSLLVVPAALAVQPDEILADQALEERARDLSKELRCVVCQNEAIDTSNAGMARDMRVLLRERLVAGDSDDEVRDFFVARYGDYVLMNPPIKASTYVLWFGPAVVLLLAAAFVWRAARRRKATATPAAALSPEEQARLDRLLSDRDGT